jgi:hypothetical protein
MFKIKHKNYNSNKNRSFTTSDTFADYSDSPRWSVNSFCTTGIQQCLNPTLRLSQVADETQQDVCG